MPFALLPARIYYRKFGQGAPLVFLHGGWGYDIYPFDRQIGFFQDSFQIFIPDRSGYGRSGRVADFPVDFHHRAAAETLAFLDALGLERPVLWGHSDGAVMATLLGLQTPARFRGIILEAFHYYRNKPGSRQFFETLANSPEGLGERVTAILQRQHGRDYWKKLLDMGGRAWLEIADTSRHPKEDLYAGRLAELQTPVIFLHGGRDPRTEPDELAAIERELPGRLRLIEKAGHSPHSESASAAECNRLAEEFLTRLS